MRFAFFTEKVEIPATKNDYYIDDEDYYEEYKDHEGQESQESQDYTLDSNQFQLESERTTHQSHPKKAKQVRKEADTFKWYLHHGKNKSTPKKLKA